MTSSPRQFVRDFVDGVAPYLPLPGAPDGLYSATAGALGSIMGVHIAAQIAEDSLPNAAAGAAIGAAAFLLIGLGAAGLKNVNEQRALRCLAAAHQYQR